MKKFFKIAMSFLCILGLASCSFSLKTSDLIDYCNSISVESVKERDYFEATIYKTTLREDTAITVTEDLASAVETAEAGSILKLGNDIVIDSEIKLDKSLTIDLNNFTISNEVDIWNESTGNWSLLSVSGAETEVTLKNGTLLAKENDCYALDIRDGAKLTIESGTYIGNISSVYVYEGSLDVLSGTFMIQQLDPSYSYKYVLNCLDSSFIAETADILVYEGAFLGFNPVEEVEVEIFEGYTLEETEIDGEVLYVVTNENIEDPVEGELSSEILTKVEILMKPGEIYISLDNEVTETGKPDVQYLIRYNVEAEKYFSYTKEGYTPIKSAEITEEEYLTFRNEIIDILFTDVLPEKEDDIISGEALFKGLTDIKIKYFDKDGNIPYIILEKNSGSVSISYKLGEYGVTYTDGTSLVIDYRYPFGLTYTETPNFI